MRILSLSASAALLGLSVVMAQANADCESLGTLSTLCYPGYPLGYGARQVEKMAPQVPLDLGGTPATSIRTYENQPYDRPFDAGGYYDLVGNRYDNSGNLIEKAAPIPSKSTSTASTGPAPAPDGYHYETVPLSPNSPAGFKGKEGVSLVPNADNFGPQPNEPTPKPNDGLNGQTMRAQSTFSDQPKPDLTPSNTSKPPEKNPIQQTTPGNLQQTAATGPKPVVAGDPKTPAPKDSPRTATQVTQASPAPAPDGYHYETFPLKPNSLGLKEGVRLVPNADNFGPQPNASSTNATANLPQTAAPDQKPLVVGDSKTSTPKDSTKIAAQSTQTSPPPAPNGYHYETFPLSPNSPAGFKGKEGVRLVPNADNFGPLPNATSTNATVDKLNPGLNGLPMRAPSTFPEPQTSAASTPTLSPENNHNPVYAPGLSARDLLGRALGDVPIDGKNKIPYYDLANNVFDMKPVNGVKPTRWQAVSPLG